MCHVRAQPPKTKTNTRNQQTASQKNTSSQTSPLTITHPFIPSQEGKQTQQSTNYQQESSIQISPLERGWGCVTSEHSHLKPKQPLKPTDTAYPNSSKNTSIFAAILTITHPFIPSQEGKQTQQSTNYQQESSIQISPLERGWGCVTSEHSHLKPKQPLKPTDTAYPNSSKNTSSYPASLTVTHPFIPSLEGKQTLSNISFPTRKQHPNLPSREGLGVCNVRAQPPKTKNIHPKPNKPHLKKKQQKHPNRAPHHNTPLYPLSRGEITTL